MNRAREAVVHFFLQRHILLRDEWLDSVLRFLRENRISMENTDALSNLVYEQWLYSDITKSMEPTGEDINFNDKFATLQFPVILQIKCIIDISSSYYSQVKAFTNDFVDNSGFEALTENEKESVQVAKPQRTLTFLLTNGTRDFKAIEFKPIKELSLLTRPGSKVLFLPKMKCRRGKFLLESWNFQLLGGDLDSYMEQYNPIKIMSRKLGIDEKKKKKRDSSANTCPPAPTQKINQAPSIATADTVRQQPQTFRDLPMKQNSPRKPLLTIQAPVIKPSSPNPSRNQPERPIEKTNRDYNRSMISRDILREDDFDTCDSFQDGINQLITEAQTIEETDSEDEIMLRSRKRSSVLNKVVTDFSKMEDEFVSTSNSSNITDFEVNYDDNFFEAPPAIVLSPIKTQEFNVEDIVLKPASLKRKAVDPIRNPSKLQSPPNFFENILEDNNDGFLNFTRDSREKPKSLIAKALGSEQYTQKSPSRPVFHRKSEKKAANNPFATSDNESDMIHIGQSRPSIAQALKSSKITEQTTNNRTVLQPSSAQTTRAKSTSLHHYFDAASVKQPVTAPAPQLKPVKMEVIELSDDEIDIKPDISKINTTLPAKKSTSIIQKAPLFYTEKPPDNNLSVVNQFVNLPQTSTTSFNEMSSISTPLENDDPVVKSYKSLKVISIREALKKARFIMGSKRFTIQGIVTNVTQMLRIVQGMWTMQVEVIDTSSESPLLCFIDNSCMVQMIGWTADEANKIKSSNDSFLKKEGAERLNNASKQIHRLDLLLETEFFSGGLSIPIIRKIMSLSQLLEGLSQ